MHVAGRYELDRRIGTGGMGTVYLGRDLQDDVPVAIKQLRPEVMQLDQGQVQRFIREGEVLRQLDHPNIVKLLAAEQDDETYYLMMEYVAGGSLRDVLNATPRLSVQRTLYIALDMADALTRAHRLEVLHRDIKPANVLLADDGTPRLTDFGMAHMKHSEITQEGTVIGTLAYLSPEALQGETPDELGDIWSFGVMLYEMLAGERPFGSAQNAGQLVHAIMTASPVELETLRPDVPTALVDLISRMLARDKGARIPSVRLVGAELEAIIRGNSSSNQVAAASVADEGRFDTDQFTPTPTDDHGIPHNLPSQPTAFIGRESELESLCRLIRDDGQRLITLTGAGGIGKSRLALEGAQQCMPQFRDGAFFVPLATLDDADMLPQAIGEAVGFAFSGTESVGRELLDYLSDKTMLLLLDTVEHLDGSGDFVAQVLDAAPRVTVLITSRQRLRLRQEQVFDLNGMSVPEPDEPLEALKQYHAVQLFVSSARRTLPDFTVDEETAPHVVRIIDLVQGLPLGIELAAAWLETLPVDEVADEINRSVDFLETDLRDMPERHRSMRAVFETSWNMMTDSEREAFMKLSIFRGGFEREAAQQVVGASLRTLTGLTNKSLLRRDPEGRYRLQALLRQYAEDRFQAVCTTQDEAYRAHAAYYTEMLKRLKATFNTRKEPSAIQTIDMELDNVRAAYRWVIQQGMWDFVEDMMHSTALFYNGRGLVREGQTVFDRLAGHLHDAGETRLEQRARLYEAMMLVQLGEYDAAMQYAAQVERYFRETGDTVYLGYALTVIADICVRRSDYDNAVGYAAEAVKSGEQSGEMPIWFSGMRELGHVEAMRGNYAEARHIFQELIDQGERMDCSPTSRAGVLNDLGKVDLNMGNLTEARRHYEAAYDIYKSYTNKRGMATTLSNLAGLLYAEGDYIAARLRYNRAYRLHREVGDRVGVGHALSALGNLAAFQHDYPEAMVYFNESLVLRRALGDQQGIADSMQDIARVETARDDYDRALRLIDEAQGIYDSIGDRQGSGMCLALRGLILLNRDDDTQTATHYLEQAQAIGDATGNMLVQMQAIGGVAEVALRERRYEDARQLFVDGLRMAQDAGVRPAVVACLTGIAAVLAGQDEPERALELLTSVENYPRTYMLNTMQYIDEVRAQLMRSLGEAASQQAITRGQALSLERATQQYLAQTQE